MNKVNKPMSYFHLFNQNKVQTHKNAFTLIELLVVITIIGILLIGLSKIDISKGQEKEKSLAFSQKIQTILETTRNNSLIGKGIGTNLVVPNAWKIEISKQSIVNGGTGIINSYYNTGGINRIPYETLKTDKYYEINKIECINLDGSYTGTLTGTGIIYMTGSELSITSTDTNCDSTKIFKIYSNYKKQFQNKIMFNGVSGVIEKN